MTDEDEERQVHVAELLLRMMVAFMCGSAGKFKLNAPKLGSDKV